MNKPGCLLVSEPGNGCVPLVLHSEGIQCEMQPSLIFFLFYGMLFQSEVLLSGPKELLRFIINE
jgi:hypothetical protein